MLLVANSIAQVLVRLWIIFELFLAQQRGVERFHIAGSTHELLRSSVCDKVDAAFKRGTAAAQEIVRNASNSDLFDLAEATCRVASDVANLRAYMRGREEQITGLVAALIRKTVHADLGKRSSPIY